MAKRVFIFDDNRDILELCTLVLESCGHEIKTSTTSNNITDQVMAFMPDIIFMDNWLPDIGGIEATHALKSHPQLKHIPVIYFSANSDVGALARKAGADGYLAKPFDIDTLEAVVRDGFVW